MAEIPWHQSYLMETLFHIVQQQKHGGLSVRKRELLPPVATITNL